MINLVGVPSYQLTFFCKHCGQMEDRHVDGKCLFDSTTFAYEPHAVIAHRLVAARFHHALLTRKLKDEMEAFLKQTLLDLERSGIPQ